MVRISDARVSGTTFGTLIVHVCPESAVGGPLASVQSGDRIKLDVDARRLDVLVSDRELEARAVDSCRQVLSTEEGTALCTWTTSCRLAKAATSISCKGYLMSQFNQTRSA